MSTSPAVRVFIADDRLLMCEILRATLQEEHDLMVCGATSVEREIVPGLEELRPDALVLDPKVTSGAAADLVRAIRADFPEVRIVIVTGDEASSAIAEMVELGVRAYLCRGASLEHLVLAVRGSGNGVVVAGAGGLGMSAPPPEPGTELSGREREVLALVARAWSNRRVARHLCITEGTVKRHMRNIFEKLGVDSRMAAVQMVSTSPAASGDVSPASSAAGRHRELTAR